jgi:hypothetical protein
VRWQRGLQLVGDQRFENRRHFFAAAAEAMRRALIEAARRKQLPKHGTGRSPAPGCAANSATSAGPRNLPKA